MADQAGFDSLLDAEAVAARLGCSTRTVRRLANSGDLPGFRLRNLRRWRASDVAAYIARALPAGREDARG